MIRMLTGSVKTVDIRSRVSHEALHRFLPDVVPAPIVVWMAYRHERMLFVVNHANRMPIRKKLERTQFAYNSRVVKRGTIRRLSRDAFTTNR
jgi:hypothetical protein